MTKVCPLGGGGIGGCSLMTVMSTPSLQKDLRAVDGDRAARRLEADLLVLRGDDGGVTGERHPGGLGLEFDLLVGDAERRIGLDLGRVHLGCAGGRAERQT